MTPPSNTPPDGDFVRYVERLTSSRLDASVHQGLLAPAAAAPLTPPAATPAAAASATLPPVAGELADLLKDIPFKTHLQRVVVLWVATQLIAYAVPGLGFLFIPALVAYAAWVLFDTNRNSSGAVLRKLRQLADSAAAGQATRK